MVNTDRKLGRKPFCGNRARSGAEGPGVEQVILFSARLPLCPVTDMLLTSSLRMEMESFRFVFFILLAGAV